MNTDWKVKKLGDVLKLEYGKPLEKSKRDINGEFPVYGANGVKAWSNKYYFSKRSIIVGRKGSAGEVNLTDNYFWPLDVTYFVTYDDKQYDLIFLYYLLNNLNLPSLAKGVKPGINRNDVYSISVSIPKLPEQKRIVKILDKAFAAIDKANENTEKNLKNCQELFDSYLNGIFSNPGKDWEVKNLGDVCRIIGGGTPSKANPLFYTGNIPWATVRDMKNDIIAHTEYMITDDAVQSSSTNIIKANNVVIATRVGLGKVCLVSQDTAINQDLRGIVPRNLKVLTVKFLFWWFKSIAKIIEAEGTGATVKGVKQPFIKSLKIPLPLLYEQEQIVSNLSTYLKNIDDLKRIYTKKLIDLGEIKKSILEKAFDGEL